MPIPDFQTLMLPLLSFFADEQEHEHSEVMDTLAQRFELSDEEKKELLPSGRQTRFDNRVRWTKSHLIDRCIEKFTL